MSGGIGDLVASLEIDIAQFVAPIKEAKAELTAIAAAATKSMATVEASIEPATKAMQRQAQVADDSGKSFSRFGEQTARSAGGLGSTFGRAAGPVGTLLGVVSLFVPRLKLVALSLVVVGALYRLFGGQATQATKEVKRGNEEAEQSTSKLGAVAKQATADFDPLIATLGTHAVLAALAYKVGIDEVIEASGRHLASGSQLRESTGSLANAIMALGSTVVNDFTAGIKASLMAVIGYGTGFTSLTEIVDYSAATLTRWANAGSAAVTRVKDQAREAALVFGTALAIWHGAGGGEAAAFHEEGQKLNQLADQTQTVITKQEALRDALQFIVGASEQAAAAQEQAASVARIGTITTVEALDKELQAIKEATAQLDAKTTASKDWKEQTKQLTDAIEKQRAAIESGSVKESPVQQQLNAAKEALDRLTMGEIGYATAAAAAAGATAAEVNQLRGMLEQTQALNTAKAQQAAADQAIAAARQASDQKWESGKAKIESMRDQIDLLSGAATQAEIAMRELSRQGYDDQQIAEIGELTAQLEALKASKETTGGKSKSSANNSAAMQGTQEAARLVLRGVGASGGSPLESLNKQQLAELKKLNKGIKGNKGTTIQVAKV